MNTINIFGYLREKVDSYHRYLEYELPFLRANDTAQTRIVVKYWTDQSKNILMLLEKNSKVAISGHLDAHPEFGTIIVAEEIQQLK